MGVWLLHKWDTSPKRENETEVWIAYLDTPCWPFVTAAASRRTGLYTTESLRAGLGRCMLLIRVRDICGRRWGPSVCMCGRAWSATISRRKETIIERAAGEEDTKGLIAQDIRSPLHLYARIHTFLCVIDHVIRPETARKERSSLEYCCIGAQTGAYIYIFKMRVKIEIREKKRWDGQSHVHTGKACWISDRLYAQFLMWSRKKEWVRKIFSQSVTRSWHKSTLGREIQTYTYIQTDK